MAAMVENDAEACAVPENVPLPNAPPPEDLPMMPVARQLSEIEEAFKPTSNFAQNGADAFPVLYDGVFGTHSSDDIDDMASRIARHLNESLRCVVHQCIVDQNAELRRELAASVAALKAIVQRAQCDDNSAQGNSDASCQSSSRSRSRHSSEVLNSRALSEPAHEVEGPSMAPRNVTSISCPDRPIPTGFWDRGDAQIRRSESLRSKRTRKLERVKSTNHLSNDDQLSASSCDMPQSCSNQSPVGMFPHNVQSGKLPRMTLKRLESRLVSDFLAAELFHATPECKDARASKTHKKPKQNTKAWKAVCVDMSSADKVAPGSDSSRAALSKQRLAELSLKFESKSQHAMVPPPQPQEQSEEANFIASDLDEEGMRDPEDGANEAVDASIPSIIPNAVPDEGEVREAHKHRNINSSDADESDEQLEDQQAASPRLRRSSPSCSRSLPLKNLTRLRNDRQEELTCSMRLGSKDDDMAGNFFLDEQSSESSDHSELSWVQSCTQRFGNASANVLMCASMDTDCRWSLRPLAIFFQILITAAALLAFARSLQQAGFVRLGDDTAAGPVSVLSLFSDVALAMGAILGLLVSSYLQLLTSMGKFWRPLRNYAQARKFEKHWIQHSWKDSLFCLTCWALAVAERTRTLLALRQGVGFEEEMALSIASFAMSSFLLASQLFRVIHTCRGMRFMLDDFSTSLVNTHDLKRAEKHWNMLQAVLRKGCASLQLLFVVLQSTIVAAVLLAAADIVRGQAGASELIAGGIVLVGLAHMFLHASAVTDHCQRLPAFVNSLHFGREHDPDRMYLVEYMDYSKAGFYIFEVRLTSDLVIKFFYVVCMALFGVATKVTTGV
eukprot:TRINITY_DN10966_c0_g1_i2.p1 TRINITY_DN10966_c0_g1~~TRINITY_DN10966_c0_g1_i2.p1  ORF type:complete len:842 (-),score=142.54 TRINITY_DN10966_c0_g1_i2:126-2651(-)